MYSREAICRIPSKSWQDTKLAALSLASLQDGPTYITTARDSTIDPGPDPLPATGPDPLRATIGPGPDPLVQLRKAHVGNIGNIENSTRVYNVSCPCKHLQSNRTPSRTESALSAVQNNRRCILMESLT